MITAKTVIGVPVYNEIDYLKQTLDCLSNVPEQKDIVFFLTDNMSDDGSYELVQQYAQNDKRFVVHQHDTNIGAYKNFVYVFEKSQSDYFMWLGAHDLIDPHYFGQAAKVFEKDKEKKLAYVAPLPYGILNGQKTPGEVKNARYNFHENPTARYLQSVASLANCTLVYSLFRREYLEDIKFSNVISGDHIVISHLLWYGNVRYLNSAKIYRRYFKERDETTDERLTGEKGSILDRRDFINEYAKDFLKLYNDDGPLQDYLCNKMLSLLEQRFGLQNFNPVLKQTG